MNQDDRRKYLIEGLLKERPEYENMQIPSDAGKQKILLRSLMNIRMPKKIGLCIFADSGCVPFGRK